nr:unnamed protein product [Callosobruchus analis]
MIFTIGVLGTNRCYQSHDIVQPCFSDPFLTNQLNYIMHTDILCPLVMILRKISNTSYKFSQHRLYTTCICLSCFLNIYIYIYINIINKAVGRI